MAKDPTRWLEEIIGRAGGFKGKKIIGRFFYEGRWLTELSVDDYFIEIDTRLHPLEEHGFLEPEQIDQILRLIGRMKGLEKEAEDYIRRVRVP